MAALESTGLVYTCEKCGDEKALDKFHHKSDCIKFLRQRLDRLEHIARSHEKLLLKLEILISITP